MLILLGIIVLWLGFGVLGYGLTTGYFTREYKRLYAPNLYGEGVSTEEEVQKQWREQRFFSVLIALAGPIGALMMFLLGGFNKHGLRFRR